MPFCAKCGTNVTPGVKYCQNCGATMQAAGIQAHIATVGPRQNKPQSNTSELKEFVEKSRAEGHSDADIRNSLLQAGHDASSINFALSQLPEKKESWNLMGKLAYGTQWLIVAGCQLFCFVGLLTCLIMTVSVFSVKSDLKTTLDAANALALTGSGFAFTTHAYLGVVYEGASALGVGFTRVGNTFQTCVDPKISYYNSILGSIEIPIPILGGVCDTASSTMYSVATPFQEISDSTYSTMQSVNKLRQDFDHLAGTTGALSANIDTVVYFLAGFFISVAVLFATMSVIVDESFKSHYKVKELEEKIDQLQIHIQG